MKISEIMAMVLIAVIVFIAILVFTVIYAYVKEGHLEIVQMALAVVLVIVVIFLVGLRRQIKKAERIAARQEITD